jgi:chemotaxis protein MotB
VAKNKCKCEEGGGAPLWCLSYGDLVTNTLVFFILLYAFSTINPVKFEQIAFSFIITFGGSLGVLPANPIFTPPMPVPPDVIQVGPMTVMQTYANAEGAAKEIQKAVEEALKEKMSQMGKEEQKILSELAKQPVEVKTASGEITLILQGDIFFDLGKATIKPEMKEALKKLVPVLANANGEICITGHTDNIPIHTPQFPSNWELGAARALAVLHFFEKEGINPAKMCAATYGEYRPRYPNDTPEHRALNRRVEINIKIPETPSLTGTSTASSKGGQK